MNTIKYISSIITLFVIIILACILVKKDSDQYESFAESIQKCTSNNQCPFYKSNKNYKNDRGGCMKDGQCELPLGLVRTGYNTYSEVDQPICHNCSLDNVYCCGTQKGYSFKSPDYAFRNDFIEREIHSEELDKLNLKPIYTHDIILIVPADVYLDYNTLMKDKHLNDIENYSNIRRDVTELILIQKILHISGYKGNISIKPISVPPGSYAITTYKIIQNEMRNTSSDSIVMTGTCGWKFNFLSDNIYNKLLISDPMVKLDEFDAGLYVKADRTNLVKKSNDHHIHDKQLKNMKFISSKEWSVDWKILSDFNPKELINAGSWNDMLIAVDSGDADVLLAPFQSNQDMSITISNDGTKKGELLDKYLAKINRDIVLKPIYGVKFIFNLDTRNFAISNKLGGTTIQAYVNRGMDRMRSHKDGDLIKKAYIQSGFMDKRVSDWKNLHILEISYLSGLNTY